MVRILDRNDPVSHESVADRSGLDSEDDDVEYSTNENYTKAEKEWKFFETFKVKMHRPSVAANTARTLGNVRKISVGPLDGRGEDLPSGKNLADYSDSRGRMNLLRFYRDHREHFSTLWITAQCEEPTKVVEVGCERFFNISGRVSLEKRTRLGVRTYERLAMLAVMIKKIYIDYEWVASEYLRRTKENLWESETTTEALKCFNLKRIIEADLLGIVQPKELTLEDIIDA